MSPPQFITDEQLAELFVARYPDAPADPIELEPLVANWLGITMAHRSAFKVALARSADDLRDKAEEFATTPQSLSALKTQLGKAV